MWMPWHVRLYFCEIYLVLFTFAEIRPGDGCVQYSRHMLVLLLGGELKTLLHEYRYDAVSHQTLVLLGVLL